MTRPTNESHPIAGALLAAVFVISVGLPRASSSAQASPSVASAIAITPAHINRALGSLDGLATAIMHRSGIPGMAIAVVHGDKVVYTKGFGVRKVGTHEMVDSNTVFQLASVSKSLSSTVVAGVVGQGKVQWSDPVAKYLSGFTLADPWVGSHVTIADLFAHRSGLPDHAGDLLEDLGYSRAAIIRKLRFEPLDPFRATWHYTNFGLTAAAQAVADAEGTTWEALSQRVLFGPLGMTSTSYRWVDYHKAVDRATLYFKVGNSWKPGARDPDAQAPAGGASSTVRDFARWMILEMDGGRYKNKQIISRDALLQTQQPLIISAPSTDSVGRAQFNGLGVVVSYDESGRLRLSHSGAFSMGAATAYELLPAERLGIVVLTNGQPMGVPESIAKSFFDIVEFGKVQRDWYAAYAPLIAQAMANRGELVGKKPPEYPAPAKLAAAYTGTYANAYYGPAVVESRSRGLVLVLGPAHRTYALKHWSGNMFAFLPFSEDATERSAATFVPATGRKPATLKIEFLNANGLGTFTKE